MDKRPYNPLDKRNLAESVTTALLSRPILPLPPAEPFDGAGLYAIYYTGAHPLYGPVSKRNANGKYSQPIYVGKAVPKGSRKGKAGLDDPPGRALHNRLREHADTIRSVENLDLADFTCRCLAVDPIWIGLGENLLIELFAPVWNSVLDGFGNHDPGSGRHSGQRPQWDVLHPGRPWASKCQENKRNKEELVRDVEAFFKDTR